MQWAKIHNLQEQSKTFNYMSELHTAYHQAKAELKNTEKRLKEVNRFLRFLGQYYRKKKVYQTFYFCSFERKYVTGSDCGCYFFRWGV